MGCGALLGFIRSRHLAVRSHLKESSRNAPSMLEVLRPVVLREIPRWDDFWRRELLQLGVLAVRRILALALADSKRRVLG